MEYDLYTQIIYYLLSFVEIGPTLRLHTGLHTGLLRVCCLWHVTALELPGNDPSTPRSPQAVPPWLQLSMAVNGNDSM